MVLQLSLYFKLESAKAGKKNIKYPIGLSRFHCTKAIGQSNGKNNTTKFKNVILFQLKLVSNQWMLPVLIQTIDHPVAHKFPKHLE